MFDKLFKKRGQSASSITINGRTITGGRSVSIINGVVIVDGQTVDTGVSGMVEIVVTGGDIHELRTDGSVTCQDVTGKVDAGGSVTCADVGGTVDAGGSVTCDEVHGNVDAGGSVKCGAVQGRIDAGGSVRTA